MSLSEIAPTSHHLVMELVREAGIDVTDWSNGKRGSAGASMNPKYCYEWSFLEPDKVAVLNLWHAELREINGVVISELNARKSGERETNAQRKARAAKLDHTIKIAFLNDLPVRVIVLAGKRRDIDDDADVSRTSMRRLDTQTWSVATYDFKTGDCQIVRGRDPVPTEHLGFDEIVEGFEGAVRMRFVRHRKREAKMRAAKIEEARIHNDGRLICEVPRCGFDFAERYGPIGENYAQVHHREPLSNAPDTGRCVTLDELAVVCANCHVMIHVGGQCRDLDTLYFSKAEEEWSHLDRSFATWRRPPPAPSTLPRMNSLTVPRPCAA